MAHKPSVSCTSKKKLLFFHLQYKSFTFGWLALTDAHPIGDQVVVGLIL